MKIIAVVNQKGGCGKTTTAVNLAAALAEQDKNVLLIDLDPQGHASIGLGHDPDMLRAHHLRCADQSEHPLGRRPAADDDGETDPGPRQHHSGQRRDRIVTQVPGKELVLAGHLNSVSDRYDVCVIDCAPMFGILTISAMVACTEVIVPVQAHYYSMEGLRRVLETIRLIRGRFHPYSAEKSQHPADARGGPDHAEQTNPAANAGDLRPHGVQHGDPQQRPAVRSAQRGRARAALRPSQSRRSGVPGPGGRNPGGFPDHRASMRRSLTEGPAKGSLLDVRRLGSCPKRFATQTPDRGQTERRDASISGRHPADPAMRETLKAPAVTRSDDSGWFPILQVSDTAYGVVKSRPRANDRGDRIAGLELRPCLGHP